MEIAVLTARLAADTAKFMADMASANRAIDGLQKNLVQLGYDSESAQKALAGVKIDDTQAVLSERQGKRIADAVNSIAKAAGIATNEMHDIDFAELQVLNFERDADKMKRKIEELVDEIQKAKRELRELNLSTALSGGLVSDRASGSNISQILRAQANRNAQTFFANEALMRTGQSMASQYNLGGSMDAARMASEIERRNQSELLRLKMLQDSAAGRAMKSLDYLSPIGPLTREQAGYRVPGFMGRDFIGPMTAAQAGYDPRAAESDAWFKQFESRVRGISSEQNTFQRQAALDYLRKKGVQDISRGFERVGTNNLLETSIRDLLPTDSSGGGRGGRGGRIVGSGGFLSGILPGGRRAGAGAVLTGLGLLAGAGPAAVPAAAGAGVAAAAGMVALVGAAATLKLAFADISSAAFTSKAAFDALTPAQQSLVMTLKSLDAGVSKPLERLAASTLIPRLTDALHTLLSPQIIGALKTSVGSMATGIGRGAQGAAGILGSSEFASKFGAVMKADSVYIRDFIVDIARLADAFFTVLKAAIPFTNWLDRLTTSLTKWINTLTRTTAASGQLGNFFKKAQEGLTAIAKLLMSVIHIAGAFGNAFGFKNSIALINLFTRAFEIIANFIKQNQKVLHDFFAGAIGAINNVLSLLKPVLTALSAILKMINSLIGGTKAWRLAFEALFAVISIRALQSILIKLGSIGVAEGIIGTNASAAAGEVGGLRGALLALGGADVLSVLTKIAGPLGVAFGVVSLKGSQEGGPSLPNTAGDLFTNTFLSAQTGKAMPPALKKEYLAFRNQMVLPEDFESFLISHMNLLQQYGVTITPAMKEYAYTVTHSGASGTTPGVKAGAGNTFNFAGAVTGLVNKGLAKALKLPPNLHQMQINAGAGLGSQEKANAAAYAYYKSLLSMPGLTTAQKNLVKNAMAGYAPPTPFQLTGGGSVGFHGPTTAGGAVFTAQQNLAQAMASGSGVSYGKQVALAKAYESASAAAYAHLKAEKVVPKDAAAKQAELTALLRDETSARKDITTILGRQYKQTVSNALAEIANAKAIFNTKMSGATSNAQRLAAETQYLKVIEKEEKILKASEAHASVSTKAGQGLKKAHDAIVAAQEKTNKAVEAAVKRAERARITAIKDVIDAAKQNYETAKQSGDVGKALIRDANTYLAVLLSQKKALQDQLELDKKNVATRKALNQVTNDIKRAHHEVMTDKTQQAWERLFGIAGTGAVAVSGERVRSRERKTLLDIVKEISKGTYGPHRRGVATSSHDPFAAIPGAPHMSIPSLIKSLQEHGVKFSKAAMSDFEKIQKVIAQSIKTNVPIPPSVLDQITALLGQIKDNTNPKNLLPPTYHLQSLKDVMKNLTAIKDPAKRKAAAEKLLEAEIYGGKLPNVSAVAGIPVYNSGRNLHPAVTGRVMPGGMVISGDIYIQITGSDKNAKELARELRNELLRSHRRNPTQVRGLNAGRNVGAA